MDGNDMADFRGMQRRRSFAGWQRVFVEKEEGKRWPIGANGRNCASG
jgi:hypothetical protein